MDPLRFSTLKKMAQSPAHCRYAMDHPSTPTPSMRLGTMAHAILLGKNMPVVYPGPVRRGKEYEAFKAQFPGEETIFLESEVSEARAIARSLMDHSEACKLLMGRREETLYWEASGRSCRTTPDTFNPRESLMVDLKTTVDASPNRFPWAALKLGYHAQMAWQQDAIEAAGIGKMERCIIVAAENRPPYAVTTFQLTDRALDFGRRLYRGWLEQFLVCERSNEWPGYVPGLLDAPEDEAFALTIGGEEVEVA